MLCFDILLQSTNTKRETTLSVERKGSNGGRERDKKGNGGKMRKEKEREEEGGGSETETG